MGFANKFRTSATGEKSLIFGNLGWAVERKPRESGSGSIPMFGHMSEKDWMQWGYLHADHHLRQFGR